MVVLVKRKQHMGEGGALHLRGEVFMQLEYEGPWAAGSCPWGGVVCVGSHSRSPHNIPADGGPVRNGSTHLLSCHNLDTGVASKEHNPGHFTESSIAA